MRRKSFTPDTAGTKGWDAKQELGGPCGSLPELLLWYMANRRDLPWRRTRDPYAIWISEVMLQQTTVSTVTPRWHRFLVRFPDVAALAAAPESDVLAEWSGLGYYSRARNLHAAARRIVEQHHGVMPAKFETLLTLPGMGRYTAAAVASIAFQQPVALVDANVERVLARLEALAVDPRSTAGKRSLWEIAQRDLNHERPGDWNQALMELGATVCLPREPRCDQCPLAMQCRARELGDPHAYPRKAPKPPMQSVGEAAAVILDADRVLVLQRPPRGSFAGMWEVPRTTIAAGESPADAATRALEQSTGMLATPIRTLTTINHTVMRQRINLSVLLLQPESIGEPTMHPDHAQAIGWLHPSDWLQRPISTSQRKIAHLLSGT